MKAVVVVLAICFTAALGELTDEQKEKLKTYKESCITETGVDPNAVKNAKEGTIDESDEKLACFATCLLKKFGVMKENGDIDIDMVRSKIPSSVPQEEADRVINICKDITGTGCWKGGNILKCVLQNKKVPVLH